MENIPNTEGIDYASMSESDMHENPVAEEVLQRKALEYLKTEDRTWFEGEYTGELTPDGYLVDKMGLALTKPMQNVGAKGFISVIQETKRELLNDPAFIQPEQGKGLGNSVERKDI